MKRRSYFVQSRSLTNSLVMTAPLFVLYQIGILFTDGWKNGVDFFSSVTMRLLDGNLLVYTLLNLVILGVFIGIYLRRRERGALRSSTWFGVLFESTFYAFLMGGLAANLLLRLGFRPPLSASILPGPTEAAPALAMGKDFGVLDSIVLSIGAGTYEELFFRLFLMGGMIALLRRAGWKPMRAFLVSLIVSSFIFSAFHYVPIGMESWQLWSFSFRVVLGVVLGLLYWYRGFAVAVYTHAIYDIFILVPRALGA